MWGFALSFQFRVFHIRDRHVQYFDLIVISCARIYVDFKVIRERKPWSRLTHGRSLSPLSVNALRVYSMKRLGVFLLPYTQFVRFSGPTICRYPFIPLYERGTVRVRCLAQEHNTVSSARARTRAARSGNDCTNHEAIAPPTKSKYY